jgi:hypothetical protein
MFRPQALMLIKYMGFWFVVCLQRVKVIQMQTAMFVLLLFSYYSYSCA